MHRNAYKSRKFGRERDQRRALLKGLAESLVVYESIETTSSKAKELVSYAEKLITKAKKGGLSNRRAIISALQTKTAASKLMDEITPKLKPNPSGHLRIARTVNRRGDNVQLAKVSFLIDDKPKPVKNSVAKKSAASKASAKPKSDKKVKK